MVVNNSEITVKKASSDDAEQIFALSVQCNLAEWSEADYRNEAERNDSMMLTARLNAEKSVIGFIAARLTGFVKSAVENDEYRELDIINFGVKAELRRKGIGRRLLEEILRLASEQNVGSVWLEVRQSNGEAIKFYESYGFTEIQIRKGFYANPLDDALVMKLDCPKDFGSKSKT